LSLVLILLLSRVLIPSLIEPGSNSVIEPDSDLRIVPVVESFTGHGSDKDNDTGSVIFILIMVLVQALFLILIKTMILELHVQ
jgi:hypothetical protein